MNCKICSSPNIKHQFEASNVHGRLILGDEIFDIMHCQDCKVSFVPIEPDQDHYKKYYAENYYQGSSNSRLVEATLRFLNRLSFQRRLALIKRFYKKHGPIDILEIGCGKGEFLSFLPNDFRKFGAEIHPAGLQHMRANYPDIQTINTSITDTEFPGSPASYQVIGLWHVLEHLAQPRLFFNKISQLLSPDGLLIFDIPNAGGLGFKWTKQAWFHLDTPRHLFFYQRKTIEYLLNQHNLKIVFYAASPIDYFQDLGFSIMNSRKNGSLLLKIFFVLIIFLFVTPLRIVISLLAPQLAEINTYIVKHYRKNDQNVQ